MEPLAPGMRFVEFLFRLFPAMSISNLTLEQIERSQSMVLPENPLTELLLGGLQKGVHVQERTIDGPGGPLPLRIYTPEADNWAPKPLVVYFHGGGWVLGSARGGDWICSMVARDADAVVVSVDYRLAPKYPFPAAVEDCYAALVWSSQSAAALGAQSDRLGVMGESAGGNLAAVVCLLAKQQGGPHLSHQALLYPATDLSLPAGSHPGYQASRILSPADMQAFARHYLGEQSDRTDWRVSPLHAPDHTGLPPAVIVVGGHDPLHDEGVRYAEKLRASGVPVLLKDYPAMPHGFANFPHFARDARPALHAITPAQRLALRG